VESIYNLSWYKDSFLAKLGLLAKAYHTYRLWDGMGSTTKVDEMSALSSTLYSVAGTSCARLSRWKPWTWVWGPLGLFCHWQSVAVSDRMWEMIGVLRSANLSVSVPDLTVDQLDIRQSILRKHKGRNTDALICVNLALEQKIERPHTKALLLIGQAELALKNRGIAASMLGIDVVPHVMASMRKAIGLVSSFEGSEPNQAVRVYRGAAEVLLQLHGPNDDVWEYRNWAWDLAQKHGIKDQIAKLETLDELLRRNEYPCYTG